MKIIRKNLRSDGENDNLEKIDRETFKTIVGNESA